MREKEYTIQDDLFTSDRMCDFFNFAFCVQVINSTVPIFDKNHTFYSSHDPSNIITHLKLYIEIKFELFLIYINQDLNFLCFKVVSSVHPDHGFI